MSIISNGSLIKDNWMRKYSEYLDILGVSCDSFVESVNIKIGRGAGKHVDSLFRVRNLCYEYNIKFKLNTVVCKYNYEEDMNDVISELQPFRWKCFQVLIVKTENDGNTHAIRDASEMTITDEQYGLFVRKHEHQPSFIKEPNSIMQSSYLILDEYMRFLDKGESSNMLPNIVLLLLSILVQLGNQNHYIASESILDVDVFEALSQINWDTDSFHKRNRLYDWSRDVSANDCSTSLDKKLDW